jgi:hypothetical protein
MTTVSARNWNVGTNGLTRFDNDCDFNGHDIGQFPASSEQCGGICIANNQCTHYTYNGGRCFMKRNTGSLIESYSPGMLCGFIPGRSSQPI